MQIYLNTTVDLLIKDNVLRLFKNFFLRLVEGEWSILVYSYEADYKSVASLSEMCLL